MDVKKFLSGLINKSQQRFVSYKELLADVHKHSEIEWPDWYKEFLRDCKNRESLWLKSLQEESMWLSQGFDYLSMI